MRSGIEVGVLGPVEARIDGVPVDLGTRKQRALLAALTLRGARRASSDELIDLLWSDRPPASAEATLQGYVHGLRRALEPGRAPREAAVVLRFDQGSYWLDLSADAVDVQSFSEVARSAHDRLEDPDLDEAELIDTVAMLDQALALWRGTPYGELPDAPAASTARGELEERRLGALEDRAVGQLRLGRHVSVVAELESLTAAHPLRERLWALRCLALVRCGRQAEALEVLAEVRRLVDDELGIEPSAQLRELQTSVLRQDPGLDWTPPQPTPEAAAPTRPASSPPREPAPAPRRSGLVGRDTQLASLVSLLAEVGDGPAGPSGLAVITGEPGIGKSRLCEELVTEARRTGARVAFGRCSQDEGAPALYPWAGVLDALGHRLPAATDQDESAQFRAFESIVRTVLHEAADPLLVVLEDLHWADPTTLRVVRLLVESLDPARLLLVATWRDHPAPTGALAGTAESLARRHALRLDLEGLDATSSARLLEETSGSAPDADDAASLARRTDGNPFFLVEYARLAHDQGGLAGLLADSHPPVAVSEVLAQRIALLPESTGAAMRVGAVLGREFDADTLADALGRETDEVLDDLDPALAAGLVHDDGERFWFTHALLRDELRTTIPGSRRLRMHADLAAVLDRDPRRVSEAAWHWIAAGSRHRSRAWRAALTAGVQARQVFAFDESSDLLTAAADTADADSSASDEERFDCHLELAQTLRAAGRWVELRARVHRLVALAETLDDVERSVESCALLVSGALWHSSPYGSVDPIVEEALRRALDRLDVHDGPHRCRAMLTLAIEIYYGITVEERNALADEAVAMARRISERHGDPALLHTACLTAAVAIWDPSATLRQLALVDEACGHARNSGDAYALCSALTLRAVFHAELGRVDEMRRDSAAARELATAHRHLFATMVLDSMDVSWHAMRGDDEAAENGIAELEQLQRSMDLHQVGESIAGARLMTMLWGPPEQQRALVDVLRAVAPALTVPQAPTLIAMMCRAGLLAEAREAAATADLSLDRPATWFSKQQWSMTAELSVHLDRPDLAAEAYARLEPLSGRPAGSGSGQAIGPVDAFLAMAAAGQGHRDRATRHADDAMSLCEQWQTPRPAVWLAGLRAQFGF